MIKKFFYSFFAILFIILLYIYLIFFLIQIKKSIKDVRGNVAEQLWKITKEVEVLIRENWTDRALRELKVPNHQIHIRWSEVELEFSPIPQSFSFFRASRITSCGWWRKKVGMGVKVKMTSNGRLLVLYFIP